MSSGYDFENLFIYDLANNHMGDMAHAKNIIREVGRVSKAAGVRGALKFQFRQLDSFIHPDYQNRQDIKYIKRFSETRLSIDDFAELAKAVKDAGLLTMSTPFDEASVDVICDLDLEIIKVASCSADDRPLIDKIAKVNKPVIVSTAGLRVNEIDWLVNHLQAQRVDFALMHCVAQYPTPDDKLQLDQVRQLRERYRSLQIGWSTHEDQNNVSAIQVAYALGARLFERHVGIATDAYPLNAYSSTPEQLANWLAAFKTAKAMIGVSERSPIPIEERQTLRDLKRGVYVSRAVKAGEKLTAKDVFFAMPCVEGQMTSGQYRPGMIAPKDLAEKESVPEFFSEEMSDEQQVYQIMLQVRSMLNKASIFINEDAEIEISHHYGLNRFREFGAVLITCINRAYAKKLVIQLPRQKHPYHYHKQKEETFQLLAGDLEIVKDGTRFRLNVGDTLLVKPGEWHKFHTLEGCVFEELSSTAYPNDSFYEDPVISRKERHQRKTEVNHWNAYFRESSNI